MKLHECHRQKCFILFIFVNFGAQASPSFGDSIGAGPGNFGSGTRLGSASRVESFKTSFVSSSAGQSQTPPTIVTDLSITTCEMPLDTLFNQNASLSNSCKLANKTLSAVTNGTRSMTNGTRSRTNGTWPATWTNGTRPNHIVWTCKEHVEQCCGIECCPAEKSANDVTSIVIIVLLIVLCCAVSVIEYALNSYAQKLFEQF
uniref:CX domain-containing protein n=1 Tax=Globodera rostochiensis TaxID=31243 RepID=A0A914I785_GLORO